ncbi:tyrosine-type recombinase/integrase [Citromicrobium bathyomarinum]
MTTSTALTDSGVASLKAPASGQVEHPDALVTGLRLRIGTTGRKAWIVRARNGSKVINRKIGEYPQMGVRSARRAASELIERIKSDRKEARGECTFEELGRKWIERVARERNSTWREQERRLELHVFPAIGDRKLWALSKADMRGLLEGLEGDVLPNRVLALVRAICRWGVSEDYFDRSPAEGIRKPRAEVERDRVLSLPEVAAVWQAANHLGYPSGPWVKALILTAQRRSEVAAMKWRDIDLGEAFWRVPAVDTKNDRGNVVPLSGPVLALLKDLPRFGPYVFSSDGKTHLQSFAKIKQRLDRFVALQHEIEPWRLHDLRRTAATHMVRLGNSTEVVGRVLNHAPTGVTAKVYALHEFVPEKRHALDVYAIALEEALK